MMYLDDVSGDEIHLTTYRSVDVPNSHEAASASPPAAVMSTSGKGGSKRSAMFSGSPKGKMAMSAVSETKYAAQLRVGHLNRKAGVRSFFPQLYHTGRTAFADKDAFKAASGGVLKQAGLLLESFQDPRNDQQVYMFDFGYSSQFDKTICTVLSIMMATTFAVPIKASSPVRRLCPRALCLH